MPDEEKPKRSSLPKGWSASDLTLDKALQLLKLPREIGLHPEDGKMISAGLGRYGPFILPSNLKRGHVLELGEADVKKLMTDFEMESPAILRAPRKPRER